MKTRFCIVIILFCSICGFGQRYNNYASSVDVSGGYAEDGVGFMAAYNYHLDKWSYVQVSIFGSISEDKGKYNIPYNIFTVQPGYFRLLWREPNFQKISFSLGGGAVFGYEVINGGNNELENGALIDGNSRFIYGVYAGLESEYNIHDKWSILLRANEYYHINSDVGKVFPYLGIGLRYFLF